MNRRKFIMLLGGAAAWPLTARAHQSDRLGRVGVLMGYRSDDAYAQSLAAALTQGLIALDWRESGNLRLDWRWAGGDPSLFERYTAELVALRPDVLVAQGSPAVEATTALSGAAFAPCLARP
jgi:putative ABC transport system substrate-binding protein